MAFKCIVSYLLFSYLFLGIFTNAFAISSFVTISTFIAFIFVLIYIFLLCFSQVKIKKRDNYFLLLFWTVLTFSSILFSRGEKCLNHYLMWSFSFFAFYYVFRVLLLYLLASEGKRILATTFKILSLSVFISSLFAIIEFVLVNFGGLTLDYIIPRGTVEDYAPLAFNFIRARSFMEESGQFALFLEIFAPITIVWIFTNTKCKVIRYLYLFVIIISLLLSFSSFGLIALFMSVLIYLYYYIFSSVSLNVLLKKLFLTCIICLFIVLIFFPILDMGYQVVMTKLDTDNSSFNDRSDRIIGLEHFLSGVNLIVGYGAAAFSTLKTPSFISLYVGILMSTGILGIVLFLSFLLNSFRRILRIKDKRVRWGFVAAFVTSTIHFCFVDLIYVPWYWTMLALSYACSVKENLLLND